VNYLVSGTTPPDSLTDAVRLVSTVEPPTGGPAGSRSGSLTLVRLGDLDGDGRSEIAASLTAATSSENRDAELVVIPGAAVPAAGALSIGPFTLSNLEIHDLVACDLDGDGLPELVTEAGIWAGTDLLIPGAAPIADGGFVQWGLACLGDIDGDGTEDLATGVLLDE
jgi:hypothetical protein